MYYFVVFLTLMGGSTTTPKYSSAEKPKFCPIVPKIILNALFTHPKSLTRIIIFNWTEVEKTKMVVSSPSWASQMFLRKQITPANFHISFLASLQSKTVFTQNCPKNSTIQKNSNMNKLNAPILNIKWHYNRL